MRSAPLPMVVRSIVPTTLGAYGWLMAALCCALVISMPACRSAPGSRSIASSRPDASRPRLAKARAVAIQRIACLYDQHPWLNLDSAGDREPEGIWLRAFLDPGTGKGVHADGTFHVEMYLIDRSADGEPRRTLVSDWHYPSSSITRIGKPGMLGDGYVLQLRWADKSVAGQEVEFIVRFEDAFGNMVRSGTKRLRIPKYDS